MMVLAIKKAETCKTPWKDREVYYNRRVIIDLEKHVQELEAKMDKIHGEENTENQKDGANNLQDDDAVVEEVLQEYYQDYSISCLLYTSPSPRDGLLSRMPSSA